MIDQIISAVFGPVLVVTLVLAGLLVFKPALFNPRALRRGWSWVMSQIPGRQPAAAAGPVPYLETDFAIEHAVAMARDAYSLVVGTLPTKEKEQTAADTGVMKALKRGLATNEDTIEGLRTFPVAELDRLILAVTGVEPGDRGAQLLEILAKNQKEVADNERLGAELRVEKAHNTERKATLDSQNDIILAQARRIDTLEKENRQMSRLMASSVLNGQRAQELEEWHTETEEQREERMLYVGLCARFVDLLAFEGTFTGKDVRGEMAFDLNQRSRKLSRGGWNLIEESALTGPLAIYTQAGYAARRLSDKAVTVSARQNDDAGRHDNDRDNSRGDNRNNSRRRGRNNGNDDNRPNA